MAADQATAELESHHPKVPTALLELAREHLLARRSSWDCSMVARLLL